MMRSPKKVSAALESIYNTKSSHDSAMKLKIDNKQRQLEKSLLGLSKIKQALKKKRSSSITIQKEQMWLLFLDALSQEIGYEKLTVANFVPTLAKLLILEEEGQTHKINKFERKFGSFNSHLLNQKSITISTTQLKKQLGLFSNKIPKETLSEIKHNFIQSNKAQESSYESVSDQFEDLYSSLKSGVSDMQAHAQGFFGDSIPMSFFIGAGLSVFFITSVLLGLSVGFVLSPLLTVIGFGLGLVASGYDYYIWRRNKRYVSGRIEAKYPALKYTLMAMDVRKFILKMPKLAKGFLKLAGNSAKSKNTFIRRFGKNLEGKLNNKNFIKFSNLFSKPKESKYLIDMFNYKLKGKNGARGPLLLLDYLLKSEKSADRLSVLWKISADSYSLYNSFSSDLDFVGGTKASVKAVGFTLFLTNNFLEAIDGN